VNYLIDKLAVELADLELERVSALHFQQRTVDYSGDWVTTRSILLDYREAPSRKAFYDACWTFVCASVADTSSKSCRLLICTRPERPFVRVEPEPIAGELYSKTPREPTSFPAINSARKRIEATKNAERKLRRFLGRAALGASEVDPRAVHSDPNTLVIFPLPLANIRRALKTKRRKNTPIDLTAQLLSASELVDIINDGDAE
jgi:hypothetical protein